MSDRQRRTQAAGRLRAALEPYVASGSIPGIVAAVRHRGDEQVEILGTTAVGGTPMRRDTIFRISSMTKPITAAAAMTLVEAGVLGLDDPVDDLLPELADRRVLARLDGPIDDTVPARRPITVRDILTFRMGLGMIAAPPDAYPILAALTDAGIPMGPPRMFTYPAPDEFMRRLGTLPLMHQPGDVWTYQMSASVLGVLLARAAGQPLGTILRERIFDPLGMRDTGFSVPPEKRDRLATSYLVDPETKQLELYDGVEHSAWAEEPVFPDAGGDLVSTVDDFLAFAQAMQDGGGPMLSAGSVALMTSDHLTPPQKAAAGFAPGQGDGFGWGFGMAVVTALGKTFETPGRYGWDGGMGTLWANNPTEDLIGVLLTQRAWESPVPPPIYDDFWTAAYPSALSAH